MRTGVEFNKALQKSLAAPSSCQTSSAHQLALHSLPASKFEVKKEPMEHGNGIGRAQEKVALSQRINKAQKGTLNRALEPGLFPLCAFVLDLDGQGNGQIDRWHCGCLLDIECPFCVQKGTTDFHFKSSASQRGGVRNNKT
jgi:hypothetical protein